jgi:hypothetical protein
MTETRTLAQNVEAAKDVKRCIGELPKRTMIHGYTAEYLVDVITALEAKLRLAQDALKDIELHSHEVETISTALSALNASSLDEPFA